MGKIASAKFAKFAKCGFLASMLFIAACQTPGGTFCDIADPIRLTDATIDAMTDEEVKDALAHNEKLRRLCGVQP